MFASGDPINVILATVWSAVLAGCFCLTWYAYFLWRKNPDSSISHRVALWVRRMHPAKLFAIGMIAGFTIGLIFGMFAGHFTWPVELEPTKAICPWSESELPTMEELEAKRGRELIWEREPTQLLPAPARN